MSRFIMTVTMKTIYWTYRMAYTDRWDRKSISFFLNEELSDYMQAWIVFIEDMVISDHQYTQELAPWLKSKTRFFKAGYNEKYVPTEHFEIVKSKMVSNHYATFFATPELAAQWVRDNTSLDELNIGIFEASPEDTETGTPQALLEIN